MPRPRVATLATLFLCLFLPACGGSQGHCVPTATGGRFDVLVTPPPITSASSLTFQIDVTTDSESLQITCSEAGTAGCSSDGSPSDIEFTPEYIGSGELMEVGLVFIPAPKTVSITVAYDGKTVATQTYQPGCSPKIVTLSG